ncbi:Protein SUPPRESSOR OF GENE SILENCING 3 [Ancistrocladus abbreviatus]
MDHARTNKSKRVGLRREFANLLDEELRSRGSAFISAGESFGQWEGLKETKDHEIVWPPMVVIMSTNLEKDHNDKWVGMGNQELLDYFSSYAAIKARHSYGPKGHRGTSVLLFESSPKGYLEAEWLHRQFLAQGTGRDGWNQQTRVFVWVESASSTAF